MAIAGLQELNAATLPFTGLAAGMIGLNLYIIYRLLAGRVVPAFSTFVLGAAVLVSQAVFWGGIAYYLEVPTVDGFVIFSLAIQFMMVPIGVWFVTLVFEEGERPVRSTRAAWPVGLALLLLINELLMSWAFAALVAGTLPTDLSTLSSMGQALLVAASTAWYYWPMAISMLVLVRWTQLPQGDRSALYALTVTAFIAPWAFEVPLAGATAMAIVMAAAIAVLWKGVSAPGLTRGSIRLRIGVALSFMVMSATWALSYTLLPGSWGLAPFAVAMVAVMTAELCFLLNTMLRHEGATKTAAASAAAPHATVVGGTVGPSAPALPGESASAPPNPGVQATTE